MMASTARIIGGSSSFREQRDEQGSLSAPERRRLRLHGHVRELQVGSAAHAHGVVELDGPAGGGGAGGRGGGARGGRPGGGRGAGGGPGGAGWGVGAEEVVGPGGRRPDETRGGRGAEFPRGGPATMSSGDPQRGAHL